MPQILEGRVLSFTKSDTTIELSPHNDQEQLKSVTLALPRRMSGVVGYTPNKSLVNTKISIQAIIGNGTFGIVYRAKCKEYTNFALKVCKSKKPERLREEWNVMCKVADRPHSSVTQVYFGAWSDADPHLLMIGMELCVPLTLYDLLVQQLLPLDAAYYLAHQVVSAIAMMHERGCIHRDIKPHNFVFSIKGQLKVIDFGVAAATLNPPPGDVVAGTISYMSPEMAHNVVVPAASRISVGAAADVWSTAAVLLCIFCQDSMYPTVEAATPRKEDVAAVVDPNMALIWRVKKGEWVWPVGKKVPRAVHTMLSKMLVVDPAIRPSLKLIMENKLWESVPKKVPKHILDWLAVESLVKDRSGNVKVEDVCVRKSPLMSSPLTGGSSPRTKPLVASPLLAMSSARAHSSMRAPSTTMVTAPPTSRNLLSTDDAFYSPTRGRASSVRRGKSHSQEGNTATLLAVAGNYTTKEQPRATRLSISRARSISVAPTATHYYSKNEIVSAEKTVRIGLQRKMLFHLTEIAQRRNIIMEWATQYIYMQNLEWAQVNNLRHPHEFRQCSGIVDVAYLDGYYCDNCNKYFFLTKSGTMNFYHCNCGEDLCVKCHREYEKKCTCQYCGVMSPNVQSFRKHITICDKNDHRNKTPSSATTTALVLSSAAPATNTTNSISKVATIDRRPMRKRSRSAIMPDLGSSHKEDNAPSILPQRRSRPAKITKEQTTSSDNVIVHDNINRTTTTTNTQLDLNPVDVSTATDWRPFNVRGNEKENKDTRARPDGSQPTTEEKEVLTHTDWVRHFYYYPEGDSAQAFIYCTQPGRLGAIFISNTYTVHSAVYSALESKLFIIKEINFTTNEDKCQLMCVSDGKETLPVAVDLLLKASTYDSTMRKQHRTPGTTSVCQRSTRSITTPKEDFLYVRELRVDTANNGYAFFLSSGAVQIFLGDEHEIRWYDPTLKFLLRPGGSVEYISNETFDNITSLTELLQEQIIPSL